jgi:hypothetical protein
MICHFTDIPCFIVHIVMTEIILSVFSSLKLMNCRLFISGLRDTSTFPEDFFCVVYFMRVSVSRLYSIDTELVM